MRNQSVFRFFCPKASKPAKSKITKKPKIKETKIELHFLNAAADAPDDVDMKGD